MMLTPDMLAQGFQYMSSTPFYLGTQFINGYSQAMGGPTFNERFYGASVGVTEQTAAAFNLPSPAMLQARAATMAPALMTPMATNPYRTLRPVPTMSFLNVLKPEYMGVGYARTMLPTEAYMEAQSQFPAATLQMLNNFGISGLGTVVGGALGSLIPIPGVGTFLGAALGNLAGLGLGKGVENIMALPDVMVTRQIANRLFRNREERPYTPIPMSQASDILNEIIKTARTEPVFNTEDVKKLFTEISQSNLMTNANYTVDQFKRDFKQLIETNRLVSQALKTSTEDALEVMKGFANVGISDTTQMQQIAFANRQAAWVTGTTEEFQMQQSTGLMQMGNQMGLYGQALGLVTMAGNNLSAYMVNELPNANQFVSGMGGAARVGQASTTVMQRLLTDPKFTTMLLGAVTGGTGNIDLETLGKVLTGQINPVELEMMGQGLAATKFLNSPASQLNYISKLMEENPEAIPLDIQAALMPAMFGNYVVDLLATSGNNVNMVVEQLYNQGFGTPQFLEPLVKQFQTYGPSALVPTAVENARMSEIERVANANLAFEQIPFTKRIENTIQSFMDVFREARTQLLGFFEDIGSSYYGRRSPDWTTFNQNMGNYGLGLSGEELTTSYYQQFFTPENLEQLNASRQQYETAIKEGRLNFFGIEFETENLIQPFRKFINDTITQFTGTENMTQQEYETIARQLETQGVTTLENYQNQRIDIEEATRETTQIELLKEIADALAEGNIDNKDLKTKIQQFLIANENDPDAMNKLYAKVDELIGTIEEPSLSLQRNTEEIKDMIQQTSTTQQYFQYTQKVPYTERQAQANVVFPEGKFGTITAATVVELANRDLTGLTEEQRQQMAISTFSQLFAGLYGIPPQEEELAQFQSFLDTNTNFNEILNPAIERLSQPNAKRTIQDIARLQRDMYEDTITSYNRLLRQSGLEEYEIERNTEGNYVPNRRSLRRIINTQSSEGLREAEKRAIAFEQELLNYGVDIYSLTKIQQEQFSDQAANLTLEEFWNQHSNIQNEETLNELKWKAGLSYYVPTPLFNTINFEELFIPDAARFHNNVRDMYTNKAFNEIFQQVNPAKNDTQLRTQIYNIFRASFTEPEKALELLKQAYPEGVAQEDIREFFLPLYENIYSKYKFDTESLAGLNIEQLINNPTNSEIQKQILKESENIAANLVGAYGEGNITPGLALSSRFIADFLSKMQGGITNQEYVDIVKQFGSGELRAISDTLMEMTDNEKLASMSALRWASMANNGPFLEQMRFNEKEAFDIGSLLMGGIVDSTLLKSGTGTSAVSGGTGIAEDLLSSSITNFNSSTDTFSQSTIIFKDSVDNFARKLSDQTQSINQLIDHVNDLEDRNTQKIPQTVAE
ncbi:MAG: hypothetical protein PWQ59_1652 [Thermoanaerobacterium sp.]|nr:hypothetical protein [Thermoanaerobacterium sp.]